MGVSDVEWKGWEGFPSNFFRLLSTLLLTYVYIYISGQIIATSRDFTPKGSVLEGKWDPLFQGNLGW